MDKKDTLNLKKRYLIWLYKTTKEALDKIERKFTQLEIDRFILKELKRTDKEKKLAKFIDEFEGYIQNKEKDGLNLKYDGKQLRADYQFLVLKLKAIEKVIVQELGNKALNGINALYEQAMIERIMQERQEKR